MSETTGNEGAGQEVQPTETTGEVGAGTGNEQETVPVAEAPPDPAAEAKPETEKDELVSDRLAKITRAEKKSRQRLAQKEKEIADREAHILARAQQIAQQYGPFAEVTKLFETDPEEALDRLGKITGKDLSYKALTHHFFGKAKGAPQADPAQAQRLAQIEQQLAQERQQREQAALAEQARDYLTGVEAVISGKPEDFEIISALAEEDGSKPSDIVARYVQEHFNATEELLTPEQACRNLEAVLEARAKRFASSGKVKRHLESLMKPATKPAEQATPSAKTLTNKLASEHGSNGSPPALSEAERFKRAIAALG